MKSGDNLVYKENRMKVVGVCDDVVFTVMVNKNGSTTPPEFFLIDDLTTWGWKVARRSSCETVKNSREFYGSGNVTVNNTLAVIEKIFLSEGWSLHDSIEAREILRPLVVYLGKNKNLDEN